MKYRSLAALLLTAVCPALALAENLAYDRPADTVHPKLTLHSQTMDQRLEKVSDGVYKAIGYDIANSVMVIGDGGVIVIDVLGNITSAQQVMSEFRQITDLPVEALIYTHHHGDHVNGGLGFVDSGQVERGETRIFAHESLVTNLAQQAGLLVPITASRAFFMYGNYLETGPRGLVNAGIGPALVTGQTGFLPPTDLIKNSRQEQISGRECGTT